MMENKAVFSKELQDMLSRLYEVDRLLELLVPERQALDMAIKYHPEIRQLVKAKHEPDDF